MKMLATALFVIVGVVNLLPVSGAVSAGRLRALYGVELTDPNLVILMRHRAVLFGIVGALLVTAAFQASLRPVALTAGLLSMLSFVVVAWLEGGYNAELRRILIIDLAASALLVGAGLAAFLERAGDVGGTK